MTATAKEKLFQKYPKIGQPKNAYMDVKSRVTFAGKDEDGNVLYDSSVKLPTLTFDASVKLHGTNAAVGVNFKDDGAAEIFYQKRSTIVKSGDAHFGFVQAMEDNENDIHAILSEIASKIFIDGEEPTPISSMVLYGEWAGQGINGDETGIGQLPKAFYAFDLRINGERWPDKTVFTELSNKCDIFRTVYDGPADKLPESVVIDFSSEADYRSKMNDTVKAVEKIEDECPVAAHYGVSGIGEGAVYKCITKGFTDVYFKVKGEKHSKSKVKVLKPVDTEKLTKAIEYAGKIMTVERMNQGLEWMASEGLDQTKQNTGKYLQYVVSDALLEETDLLVKESGLDKKDLGKHCSEIARRYFFQVIEEI